MNWYFMQGDERKGPVNLEGLKELLDDGTISSSTPVWNKGLGNEWVKVADVPALAGPSLPVSDPEVKAAFEKGLRKREEAEAGERRTRLFKMAAAAAVLAVAVSAVASHMNGKARRSLGIDAANPIVAMGILEQRLLSEYKMQKTDITSFDHFSKSYPAIVQYSNAQREKEPHVSNKGVFTVALDDKGAVMAVACNFPSPGLHGPNLNDRSIASIFMEELWAAHGGKAEGRLMSNHGEVMPALGPSCGYANVPADAVCNILDAGPVRCIWSEYGPNTRYSLVYWEVK